MKINGKHTILGIHTRVEEAKEGKDGQTRRFNVAKYLAD